MANNGLENEDGEDESIETMKAKMRKLEEKLKESESQLRAAQTSFSSVSTTSTIEDTLQKGFQEVLKSLDEKLNKTVEDLKSDLFTHVEEMISKSPPSKPPKYVQEWVNCLPDDLN